MRTWREPAPADAVRFDPAEVAWAGLRRHHLANTAYPLAHLRTWAPYRVPRRHHAEVARAAWDGITEIGLYVHVPFCESRCAFCEYAVVAPREAGAPGVSAYFDALLAEISLWDRTIGFEGRRLAGLDIGGGTPTFAPPAAIARVLDAVRARLPFAEGSDVSIETTPSLGAAHPDRLRALRALGIDRISMGIQTADPALLHSLGRGRETGDRHRRAADNIRAAGFSRFNVDLMYGLAGQTCESWESTLAHAISLAPESITLYRMRYKHTRIAHQASQVSLGEVRALARSAARILPAAGYDAPFGKNTYSRVPGDLGTSSYLARRVSEALPYLGLGLGAQSLTHTTVSYAEGAAAKALAPYFAAVADGRLPLQDLYDLPRCQVMAKTCAVAFYFGAIERAPFARKYGVPLEQAFAPEIAYLESEGLMHLDERALRLTAPGAESVNAAIPLFYAPSAQRYLLAQEASVRVAS